MRETDSDRLLIARVVPWTVGSVGIHTNAAAVVLSLPPEHRRPGQLTWIVVRTPWGGHTSDAPEVEALPKKRKGIKMKTSQSESSPPRSMAFKGCTKRPSFQREERRGSCIKPLEAGGSMRPPGAL